MHLLWHWRAGVTYTGLHLGHEPGARYGIAAHAVPVGRHIVSLRYQRHGSHNLLSRRHDLNDRGVEFLFFGPAEPPVTSDAQQAVSGEKVRCVPIGQRTDLVMMMPSSRESPSASILITGRCSSDEGGGRDQMERK